MQRVPFRAAAIAAGVSVFLAACGGSSSDDGTTTPPPKVLSITGKAATGAAMANAAVSAKCATGTGTGTAATDGSYTLSITSGALPCVLQATGTDSHGNAVTLHSVATTTTAQITPLTELLMAQVTGAEPSATLGLTDLSSLTTTFSDANVLAAQAQVVALLSAAGIDTSSLGSDSLFSGTLTVGGATGYDHVLDLLGNSLAASGTPLATLTDTVASQASDGGATTASASALAPELLLRPASANCASLRSGKYWVVTSASTNGDAAQLMTIDAVTGTITQVSDGSSSTLQANGTCRFTAMDPDVGATADIMVSPAGVIVARSLDGSDYKLAVGVPQQSHTLAQAAGDWDTIFSDTSDTGPGWVFGYGRSTVTSSASGTTLQLQQACQYEIGAEMPACIANATDTPTALRSLTLSDDGTFVEHSANDTGDGGPWSDKFFVYQAGNGEWFMISSNILTPDSSGDGSIGFATRHKVLSVPAVGTTSSNWNVYMNTATQLSTNGVDSNAHHIDSVNVQAGQFVRTTGTNGGATHQETLAINNPLEGFEFRDGATGVATSDGGTTNVRRSIFLKVPGMGISVLYQPVQAGITPNSRLVVSVEQPSS